MPKRRKQAEMTAPPLEPKRITPVDIQQKEFRLAMRGYNERDVDQFLDEVTEEVARLYADNKRLREEVEFGKTTRLETTEAGEAEGLIRQAREEAARIIAEATARASTIGAADPTSHVGGGPNSAGAPPTEIMGIFLARERAFLQNMANLIQAHAEGVKQDVRRVREQVAPHVPAAESPGPQSAGVASDTGAEAGIEAPVGAEQEESEDAYSRTAPDEPTQAWEAPRGAERPETEPSRRDLVDLTEEGEGATERAARRAGGASGEASEGEAALSSVYGRTPGSKDAEEALQQPRETPANRSPGVEDDDAKEDRSIRELFWGED